MVASSRPSTPCTPSPSPTGGSSPSAGDPQLVTFLRSSAKPIQALPLVRIAARCRRRRDRDRVRLAPGAARAARRRPVAARRRPGDRGRARDRGGADADRAQLLGQARRLPRRLQDARLRDARLPLRGAPAPAGAARGDRRDRRRRPRRTCRSRSTAAACRRSRSRSSAARTAVRRSCRGSTGATRVVAAMRAHPELLRGPVAADVKLIRTLAGLGREGWGGRALLRVFGGRAGRRAQGRGRLVPRNSPCTCACSRVARRSRRASSASSRWRTATENASGR